jgi:type II secretory pathway pseudopilin PulG
MRNCRSPMDSGSPGAAAAGPHRARAAVLLEVLIAMTLFVLAAAVIGGAMRTSVQTATRLRQDAKAANLAESVMAEITSGVMPLSSAPRTSFDAPDDAWSYEITVEDITGLPGMKRVLVVTRDSDDFQPHSFRLMQWMLDTSGDAPPAAAEDESRTIVEGLAP